MLEPWVAWSASLPAVAPGLFVHKCGATGAARHHLAMSPLHPGSPSLPLLPVWMNVSSLSPWLSDFHTVRFSISSGCFLFLNCCCPSFGCVRRHSMSAYASILARSSRKKTLKLSSFSFSIPLPCGLTINFRSREFLKESDRASWQRPGL